MEHLAEQVRGRRADGNALADVSHLLKKAFPRGPDYTRVVLDSIH